MSTNIGTYYQDTAAIAQQYIAVRQAENRLYTDAELALLPDIDSHHPHSREWAIRKRSSRAVIAFLRKKNKPQRILEIGCGNGWLSYQLAQIPGATVTGIDINTTELEQAVRVFKNVPNLSFKAVEFKHLTNGVQYDVVIFAASIQYFSSPAQMIGDALASIVPGGEIHIFDSPFYKDEASANAAANRTAEHYQRMGHPEMAAHYFHHTMAALPAQKTIVRYNPHRWFSKLSRPYLPFHWLIIKNNQN